MPDTETTIETVSGPDAATNNTPTDAKNGTADTENASADCGTQVDALIADIQNLNDKYLRLAAELENTRRRSALDCESAARNRAMSVAGHFLPVMDAIAAALTHNADDAGIQSMARAMESAFAQVGIVKIDSVGQPLNPQFHNAIQVMDAPADMTPCPAANTIISEMQAGYMFGDSVLRPAMVIVSK